MNDHCCQTKEPDPREDSSKSTEASIAAVGNEPEQDEGGKRRKRPAKHIQRYTAEPQVIFTIPRRKDVVNHSYRDFSRVPPPEGFVPRAETDDIANMSFVEKVHHILAQEDSYGRIIHWNPHGRSFQVPVPREFERQICEKYFGHKRYSSFLRQLTEHGFKIITRGPERNSHYHECFLRGLPHLFVYIPPPKLPRRIMADPDNEPDLASVSDRFPVPGPSKASAAPPAAHISEHSPSTSAHAVNPDSKRKRLNNSHLTSSAENGSSDSAETEKKPAHGSPLNDNHSVRHYRGNSLVSHLSNPTDSSALLASEQSSLRDLAHRREELHSARLSSSGTQMQQNRQERQYQQNIPSITLIPQQQQQQQQLPEQQIVPRAENSHFHDNMDSFLQLQRSVAMQTLLAACAPSPAAWPSLIASADQSVSQQQQQPRQEQLPSASNPMLTQWLGQVVEDYIRRSREPPSGPSH